MRSLSTLEKWSYAVGNMPFSVKDAAFANFVVFYYTQVQGLSGTLAGTAVFLALCCDAITDPVVGSWSDGIRSRWGRRHPLLAAGAPPTALMFLALFNPPAGLGESGLFLWLLGTAVLLRTFLTLYFIPYTAMGAELSSDYDERTIIAKARITMGWLGGLAMPAIGFVFFFQPENEQDGRLIAANYIDFGVLCMIVAAATAAFCLWGTRTVIPRLPQASESATRFHLRKPLDDFRLALRNRNFRISIGGNLAFGMSWGLVSTVSLHLGTYFWEFSADQLAGLIIPMVVATIIGFAITGGLGRRFEKVDLLCAMSILLVLNPLWFMGGRLLGILPENGHPLIYPLQCLNTLVSVLAVVILQVVSTSLTADILDEQELETGQRQEGVFFAAGAFMMKATSGLGALLAGIVIDIANIPAGAEPGSVEPESLFNLGLTTVIMLSGLALIAYLFNRQLRMSRAQHASIQQELAEGRAGA